MYLAGLFDTLLVRKITMNLKSILSALCFSFLLITNVFAGAKQEVQIQNTTTQQSSSSEDSFIGEKVNINEATADEIQRLLVGVGLKKAEAIVEYREKHGKFVDLEQLLDVQGIGKATLEKNKNRIAL